MRAAISLGCLLLLGSAVAQDLHWASDTDPIVQIMTKAERTWAESSCAAQPALRDIIAEDFQGTAPSGKHYGKADAVSTDLSNPHRDCVLDSIKVRFVDKNIALAYGSEHSFGKENGQEFKRCLVWTDTWIKRKGKWQIVAAQDTLIPCQ